MICQTNFKTSRWKQSKICRRKRTPAAINFFCKCR